MRRAIIAVALALACLTAREAAAVTATGGTVTNYTEGGTNWTAHIFTNTAATTSLVFSVGGTVEYLVVGGGGAGGNGFRGGGGGGGGLLSGSTNVEAQSYSITVGTGGAASATQGDYGKPGATSRFDTVYASGGGGGKSYTDAQAAQANGGSGGGGTGHSTLGGRNIGGTGIAGPPRQGYNGGTATIVGNKAGAGGGGAGAVGSNAATNGLAGGAGGIGVESSITGTNVYYAGGGGGSSSDTSAGGPGGNGGGGAGGNSTTLAGTSGTPNTGGGCGGHYSGGPSRTGGSGIVIVRYVAGGAAPITAVPARYFYRPNQIMRPNLAIKNQESAQ